MRKTEWKLKKKKNKKKGGSSQDSVGSQVTDVFHQNHLRVAVRLNLYKIPKSRGKLTIFV